MTTSPDPVPAPAPHRSSTIPTCGFSSSIFLKPYQHLLGFEDFIDICRRNAISHQRDFQASGGSAAVEASLSGEFFDIPKICP